MTEQIPSVLLDAIGVALITAVGGLAWVVRRQNHNGKTGNGAMLPVLKQLSDATILQTAALHSLTEASKVHNAESRGRHEVLVTILAQLQKR